MKLLTLQDLLDTKTIEASALRLANKVAYNSRKGFSASHDKQNYWEFGANFDKQLERIKRLIRKRRYEFSPYKQTIKKRKIDGKVSKSKERKIYIAIWADRIVECWLNDCLNLKLNKWFSKHSYAYRSNHLGIDKCQNDIVKSITPNSFIVRRDVTQFFYSINQEILVNKIGDLVDVNDYLFDLILNRIYFKFFNKRDELMESLMGLPFGSPMACTLSNIYLTDLDRQLEVLPVNYFRYADDFLVTSLSASEATRAAKTLDGGIEALGLTFNRDHRYINASFKPAVDFDQIEKFKYLGLEFKADGIVRLPVEKQRKVMNFFSRALEAKSGTIRKAYSIDDKLDIAIKTINEVMTDRIRSIAIIDYYLKHINDEVQLVLIDRMVAELVISTVLNKKFRKSDFKMIPYGQLRDKGLVSILHRARLHHHGHIKTSFMSTYNELTTSRFVNSMDRRKERINQMRMAKKQKRG